MNEQTLSKRLTQVGAHVPLHARLADIGSDHAYLPVALMLQKKITYAVAGEVVKGPYDSATRQVLKNGLTADIKVRLADGLAAITTTDQINTVTIAGMGGTLIRSILLAGKEQGNLKGTERLILQPNVGEKNVREWLMENHYAIVAEEILEENDKIYEIIVADPTVDSISYSPQELQFGPFLANEQSAIFRQKWQHELMQKERVIAQLKQASVVPTEKLAEIQQEISWIKELLV